jgi:hypothetical protein
MAGKRISEDGSDNPGKRGRGRPRLFDCPENAAALRMFPDVKTRRGQMNKLYFLRALQVLDYAPDYAWLCPSQAEVRAGVCMRVTIMAELGRIEDDDTLRAVAADLCEAKPTARQAVVMVRRFRTGRGCPGDALTLADVLIGCLNDYVNRHAGMTRQMVRGALATVAEMVEASYQEPEGDEP